MHLSNHQEICSMVEAQVAVIMVPFPAQGHLNQLLQLSCLISSYGFPVYYVGSAVHIQQAKVRVNGLNPLAMAKIQFHDIPTPSFASPPPDPNSLNKFPAQQQPAWEATLNQREPFGAYLEEISHKFKRVVVVHDVMMSAVVQDVGSIHNAESYAYNCIPVFSQVSFICEKMGKPFPIEFSKELPPFEGCVPEEFNSFVALQIELSLYRAGDIYNTCRLLEATYLNLLEREEIAGNRKCWAIGPILPRVLSSSANKPENEHKCLEWLDKQEPKSVVYISFGTSTSLSDEQIKEMALGLEQSKVKFIWVLRDADKGNIFDGQDRRAELPEGFEERTEEMGLVVRDWAPQPQILAHPSTGGFMSHCGWNSCVESITAGVPIAAWPMHSDQPRNTMLITEVLKMGLVVREWAPGLELVKASTIENVVKRLMASEEGKEIRTRAEEWAATVQQATQPGGASRLELDSFITHITR
ncbi:UDP-glucuronosyl and UDP-glucosyl transferase [Handroanthus impetiginosus]|uniref:Glycosyltransferase n=1 Tax=Handroanthus impetiginosus TaxID=429701 RepID=A0A2G9G246_9LAMI|nr:UDP-glucuronosyl and UDP-glucosyl transferase [Handroanthus impetiginosus]PIM99728.1 UDP-glucuronosyl and UDP-glucosyl transferase [Handroanthus impetiginosus]